MQWVNRDGADMGAFFNETPASGAGELRIVRVGRAHFSHPNPTFSSGIQEARKSPEGTRAAKRVSAHGDE